MHIYGVRNKLTLFLPLSEAIYNNAKILCFHIAHITHLYALYSFTMDENICSFFVSLTLTHIYTATVGLIVIVHVHYSKCVYSPGDSCDGEYAWSQFISGFGCVSINA